ncbi:uncharacterized protein LOC143022656 [Oratosquilla oratoria]|uniref:uncharacterized protein LOC143022656 n=1 Tax=Oratosquilla oratoria TaxID=337810 RepID=UPI003F7637C5
MAAQDNSSEPPTIYWSKALTSTLIDLYRKNPCLWNVKLKCYKNRDKRITAVKAIAAEMREHGTSVTTDDIKKKIDTLRNQYRRECKKVKNSLKSGAGSDDICVPKLWCFYDLIFLHDSENPRPSSSNLDTSQNTGNGEDTSSGETSDYEIFNDPLLAAADASEVTPGTADIPPGQHVVSDPHAPGPSHARPAKMPRKTIIDETQLMQKAYDELKTLSQTENVFSAFGTVVANNLKEMNSENQIYAQKLVQDIIFLGRLGRLSSSTKIVE